MQREFSIKIIMEWRELNKEFLSSWLSPSLKESLNVIYLSYRSQSITSLWTTWSWENKYRKINSKVPESTLW